MLTCCSTADRSPEFFKERNLPYACFHFRIGEKDYDDDLGHTIPFHDFYQKIREGAMPVTSQVNAEQYIRLWEPFLKEGKDVMHVTLSSGISGALNSAGMAKDMMADKYPDRRVLVLDSLGASSGYGLLMEYLADKRDEGMSIDELYQWGTEHRLHMHHWFFSSDLTSYWRGGRISRASAFFGNALGVCPLMNMDHLGRLIPRRNVRPKRKVIDEIVAEMVNHVEDGLNYQGKCQICNSDCIADAEKVRDLIEQKFPQLKGKVGINSVGTVIGSHTGPGTVALFFMGDERVN